MKEKLQKSFYISLTIVALNSCVGDNPEPILEGVFDNGYFVTNEGNFLSGNGSITYISYDGSVENEIFSKINSFPLGDVVQSMNIIDEFAYIIVNNSSKIEVAEIDSLTSHKTIYGFISPRYMIKVNESKAYVSDWGINGLQIIDLNTQEITGTISTGTGPEKMTISNGYVYVCNVGGWGLDNTISVIDIESDMIISTLNVEDKPNSIVTDINGDIWVLSGGHTEYDANFNVISETPGGLIHISDNQILNTYLYPIGNHPEDLSINSNGTILYYSDGNFSKYVYKFNINDSEVSTIPFINKSFYGLDYSNGYIYGTDAVDFSQRGWSYRFSENGNLVDSVQVGITPGGYCFN